VSGPTCAGRSDSATAPVRSRSQSSRVLTNPSESFDGLRTNGTEAKIIEEDPFMLSLSKHGPLFSAPCEESAARAVKQNYRRASAKKFNS